jgi:hypothetical protein
MNEKVKFAHMKERAFIPGIYKQVEKGLDEKTFPGLQMIAESRGVLCRYMGETFILPYSQFQSVVIEDEAQNVVELKIKKRSEN